MKRLNMFQRLPKEDQTFVLGLCDKLPYKAAAEQLAKPRSEGGLSLATSATSLCKYYTKHHPEAVSAEAVGQFAAAMRVNHQAHGEANFEALLGLVQTRLLEAVRSGKSIADLDKEFRTLQRIQKCFLADEKFRENNPRTQDAYLDHLKQASTVPSVDFVRNDLANDPGAEGHSSEYFDDDLTQYEIDLEAAGELPDAEIPRQSTFLKAASAIVAALSAECRQKKHVTNYKLRLLRAARKSGIPTGIPEIDAILLKEFEQSGSSESATDNEIPSNGTSKPHAISHISPNFASGENDRKEINGHLSSDQSQQGIHTS